MKKTLIFLGIALIFLGCQSPVSTKKEDSFLKKHLDEQQVRLKGSRLRKWVAVQETKDAVMVEQPDWAKELSVFYEATLRPSDIAQSYIADTLNTSTVSYRLKKSEKAPLKYLELHFDEKRNLQKMKATIAEKNFLFESQRVLSLTNNAQGKLETYQIETTQHRLLAEPVSFLVEARVENSQNPK